MSIKYDSVKINYVIGLILSVKTVIILTMPQCLDKICLEIKSFMWHNYNATIYNLSQSLIGQRKIID